MTTPPAQVRVSWLWAAVMAVLVCGPLLVSRGFALTHDMVFVPHQPFKGAWLGLDGSVPRAVPGDAVVALLTSVIPGDLVQKAVLLALVLLAGAGAAAVAGEGLLSRLAASTLYMWNPYVYERLAIGQWALLCGYASLPWVVVGARRVRRGHQPGWAVLGLALAAAAFSSPSGGVLGAVVCCGLLLGRDWVTNVRAAGLCVVLNLPWLMPSILYGGGIPADSSGVSAFAAQADTPYGVVGSLLSLGGIWNDDVWPPGRGSWVLSGCLLVIGVVALVAVAAASRDKREMRRLLLVAGIGFTLAVLPAVDGGLAVMRWVDATLPGAGLLRDSQKWVALTALAEAVGVATLVAWLSRRLRSYRSVATWWLIAGFVVSPLAVTVSLAWGLVGRLEPVAYPRDWSAVSRLVDSYQAAGGHGDVAVLPWSIYRQYGWNDDRPVLDPAPRYLPGTVIIADSLVVGRTTVAGEDPRAARIGALLTSGRDVTVGLRRLGIGIVVVERDTPGLGQDVQLAGQRAYEGRWLQLWILAGGPIDGSDVRRTPSVAARSLIIASDLAAGAAWLGCLALASAGAVRRYTRR